MIDNNTRKQAAVEFLQLVEAGRIDDAYQKHVDMQGKHHNPPTILQVFPKVTGS